MSFPMRPQPLAFPFLIYVDGVHGGRAISRQELHTAVTRLMAYPYRNYDGVRWVIYQAGKMLVEGTPRQVQAFIDAEYPLS